MVRLVKVEKVGKGYELLEAVNAFNMTCSIRPQLFGVNLKTSFSVTLAVVWIG